MQRRMVAPRQGGDRMAENRSGWAVGWTYFAAFMMVMLGFWHSIAGLSAILKKAIYSPGGQLGNDRAPPCGRGACRTLTRMRVPGKPSLDGLEAKWGEWWETTGAYRFDRSKTREEIYAIDTPPPTVSGTLHVGSVCSFTHTDLVARYQRMRGKEVFYPIGWDDNGLATERRVQNYFGVRCDPSAPNDPDFDVSALERPDDTTPVAIGRRNFIELCARLTAEDEKVFESLFR